MFQPAFIILTLVYLTFCQVTPEDKEKIEQILTKLDKQLKDKQNAIDTKANKLLIDTIEAVREKGDFKAFLCAEKAAERFITKLYKEDYYNLSVLAFKFDDIIKFIEIGTLSEAELEDIKQGVESGDYDSMVKQRIDLAEKYDVEKTKEFLTAVKNC